MIRLPDTLLVWGIVAALLGVACSIGALRSPRAKKSGSFAKTLLSFVSEPDDDLMGRQFIFGVGVFFIGVVFLISVR